MGSGIVASRNFCKVGWENKADYLAEFTIFAKEIQRHYDAGPVSRAAVSKGAAVFFRADMWNTRDTRIYYVLCIDPG